MVFHLIHFKLFQSGQFDKIVQLKKTLRKIKREKIKMQKIKKNLADNVRKGSLSVKSEMIRKDSANKS